MISEILINRPDKPGQLRIREKHTDTLGREHIKSYNCPDNVDVNALLAQHATELESQLIEREFREYMQSIENGKNPFRDASNNPVNPTFQTRNVMLSKVLTEVCTSSDPTLFMKGSPYMANLSDAELIALMGIDQAKVDEIRAKVAGIADVASFLSGYAPPLGVV